jgi:hypothetical protein
MSIEDQMAISALLGVPLADLANKAEDFIAKIHAIVHQETYGPRIAIILMAAAYLYHVKLAVGEDANIFEEAHRALFVAAELLCQSLEQETIP